MCEICDGKTETEILENQEVHIAAGRWALQGVEPGPRGPGWVYTIGLMHNFDHAELVIVGGDLGGGGSILNEIGEHVARGKRIDAGSELDLGGYVVGFETVHASYLAHGLCAMWEKYCRWIGSRPGPLRALQVVPPLGDCCDDCDRKRRCLVTPGKPGFGSGLNRSARRDRPRDRRRR